MRLHESDWFERKTDRLRAIGTQNLFCTDRFSLTKSITIVPTCSIRNSLPFFINLTSYTTDFFLTSLGFGLISLTIAKNVKYKNPTKMSGGLGKNNVFTMKKVKHLG